MDYIGTSLYFDDVYYLLEQINKRKRIEYKVLTSIVQSPHAKDPNRIWELLDAKDEVEEKIDSAQAIEKLKLAMSGNPRIVVK